MEIPVKAIGVWREQPRLTEPFQKKDSHRPDTTVSLTGTSLCTYAVEPPCTERYARWCERSRFIQPLLLDYGELLTFIRRDAMLNLKETDRIG